jgi:hypothetical protein
VVRETGEGNANYVEDNESKGDVMVRDPGGSEDVGYELIRPVSDGDDYLL